jgi:hypothetical protein
MRRSGAIRLASTAGLLCCVTAIAIAGARPSPVLLAFQWSDVSKQVSATLDEAGTRENLNWSAEAKYVVVKDIAVGEAIKGGGESAFSQEEANHLADIIKMKTLNPTPAIVQSALTEQKVKKIRVSLNDDLQKASADAGVTLTPQASASAQKDLMILSTNMAKSGFPVDTIKNKNARYIRAIATAAGTMTIDTKTYSKAQAALFRQIIHLTINTDPAGAEVEVAGSALGKTIITDKPFEPGAYTFLFRLKGYKDTSRTYHVLPYPAQQQLDQPLPPDGKP